MIRLRHRQYDPAIIERIIRLVFGPSRAFYRSFLKRCTLTNRAVGSLWRALSKPINRFNHASGVAVVTPTDRSKSFRNRCLNQSFWWRFCRHVAFWVFSLGDIVPGTMDFCHRTESDLFIFLYDAVGNLYFYSLLVIIVLYGENVAKLYRFFRSVILST